jgi:hypothetical protein
MRTILGWSLALLALVSCASPSQLARNSERLLDKGQVHEAYETARRGVDKDRKNAPARKAMTAAATRRVAEWEQRVLAIAQGDTVAAARFSLELRDFRIELDHYPIFVPADPAYAAQAARIRDAAAGIEYRYGDAEMAAHRPKAAYARFRSAADIVGSYRDAQSRIQQAFQEGLTRVAIVPFANDTDVPNLSKGLADAMYGDLANGMNSGGFLFTELADPNEVYASMTVKELERLSRDGALRVGRGIDVDRVVAGRLSGLRTSSSFRSFDRPIYRRMVERDTSGKDRERWVETRFTGVSRGRRVTLRYELDVLDTRTGDVMATIAEPLEAEAHVAWTDFRAEGDCSAYAIIPPDLRHRDPIRAKDAEDSWRECFGSWNLPELLERARRERRRANWHSDYRGEIRKARRDHPILLGELPSEDELTWVALDGVSEKLLEALREMDAKD